MFKGTLRGIGGGGRGGTFGALREPPPAADPRGPVARVSAMDSRIGKGGPSLSPPPHSLPLPCRPCLLHAWAQGVCVLGPCYPPLAMGCVLLPPIHVVSRSSPPPPPFSPSAARGALAGAAKGMGGGSRPGTVLWVQRLFVGGAGALSLGRLHAAADIRVDTRDPPPF